jgi:hypothetical protein
MMAKIGNLKARTSLDVSTLIPLFKATDNETPSERLRNGHYDLESALGDFGRNKTKDCPEQIEDFYADESKIMGFLRANGVHRVDVSHYIEDRK